MADIYLTTEDTEEAQRTQRNCSPTGKSVGSISVRTDGFTRRKIDGPLHPPLLLCVFSG